MKGLTHSYVIHHIYRLCQQDEIDTHIAEIYKKYQVDLGNQFQITSENLIVNTYSEQNRKLIEKVEKCVVEWRLNTSSCINLVQLVSLISQQVISIKLSQFLTILSKINNTLKEIQDYTSILIDPSCCWIILEPKSNKLGWQCIELSFTILIIPKDGCILLDQDTTHIQTLDQEDHMESFLAYCNGHLFQIFNQQEFLKITDLALDSIKNAQPILNPNNVENIKKYDVFQQKIKFIKQVCQRQTYFEQYLFNIKFQKDVLNQSSDPTCIQVSFFDRINEIMTFLELFVHPELFFIVKADLMKQFKFQQCFNIDEYMQQFYNKTKDSDNKEIDILLFINLRNTVLSYEQSKYHIIQEFGKKACDVLQECYKDNIVTNVNITILQELKREHQSLLDNAFQTDLRQMFSYNYDKFQNSKEHLQRFCNYFKTEFIPTLKNDSRYLAFQLDEFQAHINQNYDMIKRYLFDLKSCWTRQYIYQTMFNQQLDKHQENFSNILTNKILDYLSENDGSQKEVDQIKQNLKLIQYTMQKYIEFIQEKYNNKLENDSIIKLNNDSYEYLCKAWSDIILEKSDIVEVLTLKQKFTQIIIRDIFEQKMKEIIDQAYKKELIVAYSQQEFNIANK